MKRILLRFALNLVVVSLAALVGLWIFFERVDLITVFYIVTFWQPVVLSAAAVTFTSECYDELVR